MNLLVVTASRHGWTTRIGGEIAATLRAAGLQVRELLLAEDDDVAAVLLAADPTQYDAAVVGASVYTKAWLVRAVKAQDLLLDLGVPVYAFGVGVLDVTPDPTVSAMVAPRTRATAGSRVVFGGRITREGLSGRERSLLATVRAKDGEYTDWRAVRAWAGAVAASLPAPETERSAS